MDMPISDCSAIDVRQDEVVRSIAFSINITRSVVVEMMWHEPKLHSSNFEQNTVPSRLADVADTVSGHHRCTDRSGIGVGNHEDHDCFCSLVGGWLLSCPFSSTSTNCNGVMFVEKQKVCLLCLHLPVALKGDQKWSDHAEVSKIPNRRC